MESHTGVRKSFHRTRQRGKKAVKSLSATIVQNLNRIKTYAIRWKSIVNGRMGMGNLRFEKEEAERRAAELNEECPGIKHEAVISNVSAIQPAPVQPAVTREAKRVHGPASGTSQMPR
jgi:hypothetical protein